LVLEKVLNKLWLLWSILSENKELNKKDCEMMLEKMPDVVGQNNWLSS